ncbi:SusC/RagA family TonB-linked outer membrane protein [Carboxylicivirga marina]|uniref:SusC/RagA family TonB-linked outer membrane protein n=1 Tax=Carboxylicivirga marina TaxID=2800988 RepID=UPI0025945352|nr:SusC/RagA family TonB-linked outer membrane protein [uncultured Carboxylicivirga sp.]
MKKKSMLVSLTLILLLCAGSVLGQTKTITGVVKDAEGNSLPGANVVQKGTSNGSPTDMNGEFFLTVPEDATIQVSFLGFQTYEFEVKGRKVFEITLREDETTLDEVVAIGYQTVHKRDVTASVSSIRADAIENIPVTSVSELLGTQTTGVQAVSLSGAPGARGSVVIRGNTSIGGALDANTAFSNPLYVVDGVQTSLEDLAGFNVSNTDFLASLNPTDIESIDILKDASAAAIYGSRGANGVIIINTKGGKSLEKPEFTFTATYGVQPEPELVPMLVGGAERRAKMDMVNKWWSHKELLGSELPMVLSDSLNPAFNNNVDYQGLFYQQGVSQQYSLSMRGGSDASNYRLSVGYNDNKGVITATGFKRYTVTANVNSKVGRKFTNQFRTNLVYADTETGQGNPYMGSFNMNNALPVNPARLNSSLFEITDAQQKSLEGELDAKLNEDRQIQTTLSNLMRFQFYKDLAISSQFTTVYSTNKKNFYEPSTVREEGDGFASYSLYSRFNISTDTYLNYIKDIGVHNITGILGVKTDYNRYEDMYSTAVGFGSDAIKVINDRYTKDEIWAGTDISENSMLSYFARVGYRYKQKYILGATFSMDGSSRFGPDVRWAKFPSASAAWLISEESFAKELFGSIVDLAKVRASWGINGKQFQQNYLRYGAYSLGYGGNAYWSNQMNVSSYAGVTGVKPNYGAIGNDKLSWENSEQWDIGFDLEMFDHRFNVTFDAYHKQTDKLFFDVNFPAYSGYNTAKANVAGILNYGWETMINYHIFPRTNKLRLDFTLGLAQNRNYISALPNGNRDYTGNDYGYVVGRPINLYKMFDNDYIIDDLSQLPANPYTGQPLAGKGAWAAIRPGFPIWKDLNGDYILNETHDLQLVREFSPVPEIQGSFNMNLQYKGWYLQAYSQFSFGADIKNTVLNSYMDAYDRGGDSWARRGLADLSAFSFWEKPGDGAAGVRFPALYPSSPSLGSWYGFRGSQTLWIESGDYWKITSASLGYTFDKNSIIEKWGLTRLRVYANILNPWMWQRSDAVVDASMVDAKGHVMGNGYPQAKTISFGVDVRF